MDEVVQIVSELKLQLVLPCLIEPKIEIYWQCAKQNNVTKWLGTLVSRVSLKPDSRGSSYIDLSKLHIYNCYIIFAQNE